MSGSRRKARKVWEQKLRMRARWPTLEKRDVPDGLAWQGRIRGFQRPYLIDVVWLHRLRRPPSVFVIEPKIAPRAAEDFTHIPHLNFNDRDPERSALCLYDPEGQEWDDSLLIAETMVPWASEWLHHYELWRFDGVWRGRNAPGPISVAEMRTVRIPRPHGSSRADEGKADA